MSGVLCAVCGDVIGVYEPLVVVGLGPMRSSSLLREPELRSSVEVLAHSGCAADLGFEGTGRSANDERLSGLG